MVCPKCGSENIQVTNEVKIKQKRGCLWWCLIGWWLFAFIGIFTFLFGKKNKVKNKTVYVCMACGKKF